MVDAARLNAIIATHGEAMTLTRPGPVPVVLALKGKRFGRAGAALVGAVDRGDVQVKIGNAEIVAAAWPGPPRHGDELVMGGETYIVQDCDTRLDSGVVLMHILKVNG